MAAAPAFGFQAGADGHDGIDGDPGTDGTAGERPDDVVAGNPPFNSHALGNHGGKGGTGGDGIDGDDEDGVAAGGNGGAGGAGGDAFASLSATTFARGGNGGNGGMFGRGTSMDLNGIGGNGGLGGDGFAFSEGAFPRTRSQAVGGTGGDAYGTSAFAGDGGQAFVRGGTQSSMPELFFGLTASKYGGNGGTGFLGASGGNGASISYGIENEFEVANLPALFAGWIRLDGRGGKGGDSENGVAGNAGNAIIDLAGLQTQLWRGRAASRPTSIDLYGGFGGRGIATGNQQVSGKSGGSAELTNSAILETNRQNDLYINLRGGNGGSALGRRNSGHGGHGGVASLGSISMDNSFKQYFRSHVEATVTGGDGGHANGTGRAGNGASVEINDAFTMKTTWNAHLGVTANGGNGGWGRGNGNGGHAFVASNNAITQTTEIEHDLFNQLILQSNGGNAGLGVAGEIAARGGNATAMGVSETPNKLSVDVRAKGGIGNFGKSGDSIAHAEATVTGGGDSTQFAAWANALADAHLVADFDRVLPSIGTNSTANALATSHSASDALARSRAVGGWGFLESGRAQSTAYAENNAAGDAKAISSSFSHGDRNADTENFSTSLARSKSLSGRGGSTSVAAGTGHFSRVTATAATEAIEGFAHSEIKSSTFSWNHSANITNHAAFTSANGIAMPIESSTHFGFRQTGFSLAEGIDSSVDLLVIPDRDFADSILASSGITDVFNTDSDILGLGRIGGSAGGESFDGRLEINSTIDLSLRLQPFHDDKNLILGLFGAESTGTGFEDLSLSVIAMGESVIDESFTSLAEATSFFNDHLFNLGELNNEESLIDFQIEFSMNLENADDAFTFDFVFGNADPRMPNAPMTFGGGTGGPSAVPEPTGLFLMGLTWIGMMHQRRRQPMNEPNQSRNT